MEKLALVIRGPAAVGKSTVAAKLHEKIEHSAHVDVDLLKRMISLESTKARTEIAHKVALSFVSELAAHGFSIIIEEIFREKDFAELQRTLKSAGYEAKTFFLWLPKEELVRRDAGRQYKVKGEEVISRLAEEIQPYEEDIIIDVSGLGAEEVVQKILAHLK